MSVFDYTGPSNIARELETRRKVSRRASQSVEEFRNIKGTDLGTIYGLSHKGDESVNRFNALRAMQLSKNKLQVKLSPNESHGDHDGDKEKQA